MPPRSVYVHVPFCARRCSYCDFAIAVRRVVPARDFVDALRGELAIRRRDEPPAPVDTVYLGGGTPSRLGADGVRHVVDAVREHFPLAAGAEVTLEANPDDVTADAVAAWLASGINRVSLGVQSFDDRALTWMHRTHDAAAAVRAVHTLADGGIESWSVDLIFALPEHLGRDWHGDVAQAVALQPSHISLYGLTVEPHTPIDRWRARGDLVEGGDERYEAEFLHADSALTAAGFDHYEVSNFGRPGQWSRHNRGYWSGASYVGLGPAAHGYDGTVRRWNEREYVAWMARVRAGEDPVAGQETLTAENRDAETVYLGLRTTDGLPLASEELALVSPWIDTGWARLSHGRLVLTPLGWLRLDALAASLTRFRSR